MKPGRKIEEVLNEGYHLDISDVFTKAYEIYKKTVLFTALGLLLTGILVIILAVVLMTLLFGFDFSIFENFDPQTFSTSTEGISFFIMSALVGLIIGVAAAPISAGFLKLCKDAKDQKELSFGTIFSYYQPKYFGNIAMASILIGIISGLFSYLTQFVILFPAINYLVTIFISTLTAMMVPLIIFKDFNAIQAIEYSSKIVAKNFFMVFILILLATIIGILGAFLCGIGVLFSFPFYYAVQFCIYDEAIGEDEVSEIDMLGNSEEV